MKPTMFHVPCREITGNNTRTIESWWTFDPDRPERVKITFGHFATASARVSVSHLLTGMEQIHQELSIAIAPCGVEVSMIVGQYEEPVEYRFPRGRVEQFVTEVLLRSAAELFGVPCGMEAAS